MLALAAALAAPVAAQYAVAPLGDADQLASQMRVIGANPTDVVALTQAGELSTRLGDLSAAASLFARANKVDPRNGRVKAGMAAVLLHLERPGEALSYYNQAEGYGYPVSRFAAERGLAYDLVAQQGRAQRDYRLALAGGTGDDETMRRYALSLGISGQKEAALRQLEPLLRRNDRAAWRARAFVLAMNGEAGAATTIATTMMAPGQASGMTAFFARLPALGPAERAFAVQFGEVRPTPQRLADLRFAPALAPLASETVAVARAAPPVQIAAARPDKRKRPRKGEVQLAAVIPPPAPALPTPPAYGTYVPASRPLTPAGALPSGPGVFAARPQVALAPTRALPARSPLPPPPTVPAREFVAAPRSSIPSAGSLPPLRQTATIISRAAVGSASTPPPAHVLALATPPARFVPFERPGSLLSGYIRVPSAPFVARSAVPASAAGSTSVATAPSTTGRSIPLASTMHPPPPNLFAPPAIAARVSLSAPPASAALVAKPVGIVPPTPARDASPAVTAPASPSVHPLGLRVDGVPVVGPAGSTVAAATPADRGPARAAVGSVPLVAPVRASVPSALALLGEVASAGLPTPTVTSPPRVAESAVPAATAFTPPIVSASTSASASMPVSSPSIAGIPAAVAPLLPDSGTVPGAGFSAASVGVEPAASEAVAGVAVTDVAPSSQVLARIVSALPVPASELNIAAPLPKPVVTPKPAPARQVTVASDAVPTPPAHVSTAGSASTARKYELAVAQDASPEPRKKQHATGGSKRHDDPDDAAPVKGSRTALAKADIDSKSTRAKHGHEIAADDEPASAKHHAADSKSAARKITEKHEAEPQKYWVQVAGGANEASLGKAWSTAQAKAPALAGRKGYTAPLHATNRVLAGPFKNDDEARAFVNTLNKQGVHAFQFTNDKGQKVKKLDGE